MRRKRRTIVGVIIGVGISGFALAFVLRWAGWEPLKQALQQADISSLGLAVLIFFVSVVAGAKSWGGLLGGDLSIWRVLAALNEGYLLNNVLPWRMGEIGRAVLLGRKPGMTVHRVLSTILVERLYDIILALTLFLALLPLAVGLPGTLRSALMGSLVMVMAFAGLWVVLRRPYWLRRIIERLPGGIHRWGSHWERFQAGLESVNDAGVVVRSFLWMVVSWALAGLKYWLVLRAFLPQAELIWAFFMLTITLLGAAVPSLPGYIGVYEAAGVLALSVFDVPGAQALAVTIVMHAIIYLISSGLGILALLSDGETLGDLYRDVRGWLTSVSARQVG
jgi:uncharacterized protein (TIRG00374 family)